MSPLVWFALLIAVAWLAFRPVFNITTQEIAHYDVGLLLSADDCVDDGVSHSSRSRQPSA